MNDRFDNNNNKTPASAGVWFVYMMTNKPNGVLYVGVTNDIESRVQEHKISFIKTHLLQNSTVKNWFIWKNLIMVHKLQFVKSR